METREITLIVSSNYRVPSFLLQADPVKVELALNLADALLESGNTFNHDATVKTLQEKLKHVQMSNETHREEAVRIARAELKAEAGVKESLIQELKRDKERLEQQTHNLDEKLKIKELKVDELQEKLQQRIAIQSNSSKRGLEGEKDFQTITTNIKQWRLESVGKTKESADFRSMIHSMEVRFEVKNHETLVPYTKNVDKFERDMKEHPETKVGVFVALTARIEKLDDYLTVRWTDDNQLLVFIPYFLTRDLTYTYEIIEGYIEAMRYMLPFLETKDVSKDIEKLKERITNSMTAVNLLDKQVCSMQKEHSEYNTKMVANYESLKSYISSTLTALTGKEQEVKSTKRKSKKKEESSE